MKDLFQSLREKIYVEAGECKPNSISLLETRKKMSGGEMFLDRKEDICVTWPQFSQKRSERVEVWIKKA